MRFVSAASGGISSCLSHRCSVQKTETKAENNHAEKQVSVRKTPEEPDRIASSGQVGRSIPAESTASLDSEVVSTASVTFEGSSIGAQGSKLVRHGVGRVYQKHAMQGHFGTQAEPLSMPW